MADISEGGDSGQARYDNWGVGGGGWWGGIAVRFRPNTKSGGPLIDGIGPTIDYLENLWAYSMYLNTLSLLPVTFLAEEGEAPGPPSLGYVSFGYIYL